MSRSVHAAHPASACSADVDVGKGSAAAGIGIEPCSTDQLRIARFDALDSVQNQLDVCKIDFVVAVQLGHLPFPVLIDEDVGGLTKLVAAVSRAAFVSHRLIVRGS